MALKIPTIPVGGNWRIERIADAVVVEVAMQNAFVSNHIEVLLRAVLDGCGIDALLDFLLKHTQPLRDEAAPRV